MSKAGSEDQAALERAGTIADELSDIGERLRGSSSTEVTLTLVERATELAEEAARLLEQVGRAQP
jgi:hypothetical protein